jgi:hypothetical protein
LVKIYFVVFWVMTPCSLVGDTNVSKHYIASMFKFVVKILKMKVERTRLQGVIISKATILNFDVSTTPTFTKIVSKAKHDDGEK